MKSLSLLFPKDSCHLTEISAFFKDISKTKNSIEPIENLTCQIKKVVQTANYL
jgi:hypothetical protein